MKILVYSRGDIFAPFAVVFAMEVTMNKNIDYIGKTVYYLKNYNQFKISIKNLTEDIEVLQQTMQLEAVAPIAKYGDDITAGGNSELTAVEAYTAKKAQYKAKIVELQNRLEIINRIIKKVDRSIEGLEDEEKRIVISFYLDNKTWREIAQRNYISEQWAKKCRNKAVRRLSRMLFGLTAIHEQLDLFI